MDIWERTTWILCCRGPFIFCWFCGFNSCGILASPPGIEPEPPALEAWSSNHWTAREVPCRDPFILFIPIISSSLSPSVTDWYGIYFVSLSPHLSGFKIFFFQVKITVTYALIYLCFQWLLDFQILIFSCYFFLLLLALKVWLLASPSSIPPLTLDSIIFKSFISFPKSNSEFDVNHSTSVKLYDCKILRLSKIRIMSSEVS